MTLADSFAASSVRIRGHGDVRLPGRGVRGFGASLAQAAPSLPKMHGGAVRVAGLELRCGL